MTARNITIALAGNPNSGKTTVFNNLTGGRQHVGNWPGVTVEKKEGNLDYRGHYIEVVDLPGVYSLTAYSPDELIARSFILNERPDMVVNIVDASNLERNLYLSVQLLELGAPLVIALNMMDEAAGRGYQIDAKALSRDMGVAVVPMIANRNWGTDELLREIIINAESKAAPPAVRVTYNQDIAAEIDRLEELISGGQSPFHYPPRWLAIKLLENDEEIIGRLEGVKVG